MKLLLSGQCVRFVIATLVSVQPTIQIQTVTTPASTQNRNEAGEEVNILDLDKEPPAPVPSTSTGKVQPRRGTKRAHSTNTAPDYSDQKDDTVSGVYYPAYLFQEAPSQLKIDELRRHAIISEIKKNDAMCNFFELARGVLGPLKDALLVASGREATPKSNEGDHAYKANDPRAS